MFDCLLCNHCYFTLACNVIELEYFDRERPETNEHYFLLCLILNIICII